MSYFLSQNGNWRGGYHTVSIIQFALAAVMILSLRSGSAFRTPSWSSSKRRAIVIGNREAIKQRGVLAAVLSFFSTGAGETTTGLGRRRICQRSRY
jgi:hypothetical protein